MPNPSELESMFEEGRRKYLSSSAKYQWERYREEFRRAEMREEIDSLFKLVDSDLDKVEALINLLGMSEDVTVLRKQLKKRRLIDEQDKDSEGFWTIP